MIVTGKEGDKTTDNKQSFNERAPGQGNSDDGVTRRLGKDIEGRGKKEKKKQQNESGKGEEFRSREGSQGVSKGQH